ncbi:hypothetical protein cd3_008 [Carnobacterium phage cd3]|uniref:Uncharacterized protein n=2 Tax=Carnodivirus TaxID=3044682 RepID=A0AAE7VII7_9CAUD|nr:hypothetical protein PQD68_gp008 [Carnobacterium phage cd2]YP_010676474.1 hypothetical protein PQD69_gp008 [Carnobacterium phage cd4]QXP45134.1 hypothetical protein cd2_008 [Carnobacterium phage cd2]QXP45310.1 hypothetical protein cd3_008 [Carnobacterium phage cd3]QXP45393.1 hypothetical protein cd4_008 [Carnobacterium phage cd4]
MLSLYLCATLGHFSLRSRLVLRHVLSTRFTQTFSRYTLLHYQSWHGIALA